MMFGPVNPIFAMVVQEHTPLQMLGRVFGALTAFAQAGIPIGPRSRGSWSKSGPDSDTRRDQAAIYFRCDPPHILQPGAPSDGRGQGAMNGA
jgi:hypothetical protein